MKKEGSKGVSTQQFQKLAGELSLTVEELSKVLGLGRRNSQESTHTLKLTPDKAERFLALKQIMALTVKLHRERSGAARWMRSPVPALRGRTPLECAATLDGLREVESLLNHFNEVVYFREPQTARASASK